MPWAQAKVVAAITAIVLVAGCTTTPVASNNAIPREAELVSQLKKQCTVVGVSYQDDRGVRRAKGLNVWGATNEAFVTLGRMTGVEELSFTATDLRQSRFDEVGKMTSLKSLEVVNCEFLPEQLKVVQSLTNLETLELMFTVMDGANEARASRLGELSGEETQIRDELKRERNGEQVIQATLLTDRFMPCLSKLTKLKTLCLVNTFISSKGLNDLKALGQLETADITLLGLTGKTAQPFESMSKLRSLRCFKVDNEILAALSSNANLEDLEIGSGDVTDAGIPHLLKLQKLRRLYIRGNKLTDSGLSQLSQLPKLEGLDLDYSERISEGGVTQFRKRRPDVYVKHDR